MPGPADGGALDQVWLLPDRSGQAAGRAGGVPALPVLADCREWALSGRHLLGAIVGAICRGACARQATGARKHALV